MKKIMYLLSIMILVTLLGCGSTASSTGKSLTMTDFTKAYTAAGVEVDTSKKQAYAMVGAKDGVIFYMNNGPVKIYEYASMKELDKAKKDFPVMKDWAGNGLFVLETSQSKAKDIFEGVK